MATDTHTLFATLRHAALIILDTTRLRSRVLIQAAVISLLQTHLSGVSATETGLISPTGCGVYVQQRGGQVSLAVLLKSEHREKYADVLAQGATWLTQPGSGQMLACLVEVGTEVQILERGSPFYRVYTSGGPGCTGVVLRACIDKAGSPDKCTNHCEQHLRQYKGTANYYSTVLTSCKEGCRIGVPGICTGKRNQGCQSLCASNLEAVGCKSGTMPSGGKGYFGTDCALMGAGCEIGCGRAMNEVKDCVLPKAGR